MSNEFDKALRSVLVEYTAEVRGRLNAVTSRHGQELAARINSAAPVGETKKQSRSWRSEEDAVLLDKRATVYSTDYRKAHLLENGHLTRKGTGRVPGTGRSSTTAYHFIEGAVEETLDRYISDVSDALRGG